MGTYTMYIMALARRGENHSMALVNTTYDVPGIRRLGLEYFISSSYSLQVGFGALRP